MFLDLNSFSFLLHYISPFYLCTFLGRHSFDPSSPCRHAHDWSKIENFVHPVFKAMLMAILLEFLNEIFCDKNTLDVILVVKKA